MNTNLHWLVFGAGAIGAYTGGSLAWSGQRVVFLERPEVAEQVRRQGLRLTMYGTQHTLSKLNVAASVEEALAQGPFDAAIFALKSYDTPAALQSLAPHADALPPFLCLQNGVENEPALEKVLGAEKVIPGTVTSAIGRRAPGEYVLEKSRGLGLAAEHPLSLRMAQALNAAGINARLYPSAASMKWSKMFSNLLTNASSAILDMPPAEILAHPGLYRLEIAQLREALRVMSALSLQVIDLPGAPVRALAWAARLPAWLSRPLLGRAAGSSRGGKMPSFHIDLHSGRGQSEVGYLNGAVVRFGQTAGIPTPVNRLLTETLLALTRGELPLSQFARQPEQLLAHLPEGSLP